MTAVPAPAIDVALYPLPAPAAYVDMGGPAAKGPTVRLDRPGHVRLEVGRGPA